MNTRGTLTVRREAGSNEKALDYNGAQDDGGEG